MSQHPGTGVMYGWLSSLSPTRFKSLISINLSTGAGTPIGTNNVQQLGDIDFRPDGTLFGVAGNNHLYSINLTTGAVTSISTAPGTTNTVAISIAGNIGWTLGYSGDDIFFVDTTTGVWTDSGNLTIQPFSGSWAASAYQPDGANNWVVLNPQAGGTCRLGVMDLTSGYFTNVGSLPGYFDAIAWTGTGGPPPFPKGPKLTFPGDSDHSISLGTGGPVGGGGVAPPSAGGGGSSGGGGAGTGGGGSGGGGGGTGGGGSLAPLYAIYDAFTPIRTVTASGESELRSALSGLAVGDDVTVLAGIYSGTYEFSKVLASPARITFMPGVNFTGGPVGSGVDIAVHVTGSNLILRGAASVSNPGHDGIRLEGATNCILAGLYTHNNGLQGCLVQAGSSNCWLDGIESTGNGTSAAANAIGPPWPTYYKSGVHGVYWGDATVGGGMVNCYIHDQPNGYGIQVYDSTSTAHNSIFAFNTVSRAFGLGDGSHPCGMGVYAYSGGSSLSFIANVFVGNCLAGIGDGGVPPSGVIQGCVFWDNPQDFYNDSGIPYLVISDKHDIDPRLNGADRPMDSTSPLKNLASAYPAFLPRNDFSGALRTTADSGAFNVP